ncbi:MAG: hypothetical protein KAW17_05780 [Candidatus Eisenbacteria sp.]|nr:hypothetical protein [Candidatus Eisenbacteria bacterium]
MTYKSQTTLLGFPLVHVATAEMRDGRIVRGIARGWIAIGDISFGVIVSIGAVSIGGIALGGVGLGLLSLAGLSIGVFALGGVAVGIVAMGGFAVAWHAAMGGAAIAREFALGESAIAEHANDEAAREFFSGSGFLAGVSSVMRNARWLVLLAALPVIQAVLRRKREKEHEVRSTTH